MVPTLMGTEKGQFMFYCSFSFYIEFGRGDSFWLEYSNSGRGCRVEGKIYQETDKLDGFGASNR